MRKALVAVAAVAMAGSLAAAPAHAAKLFINLDPGTAFTANGATGNPFGVTLPGDVGGSPPEFTIRFGVPQGYQANSPLRLVFGTISGSNCGKASFMPISASAVSFFQPLRFIPVDGGLLDNQDGTPSVDADGTTVIPETIVITPDKGSAPVKQGDTIALTVIRNPGDSPNDSCTGVDLDIVGIRLKYTTN